jgi:hypothetical protein
MFGRPDSSRRHLPADDPLGDTVARLYAALVRVYPTNLRAFAGVAARHMRQMLCELAGKAVIGFTCRDITGWGMLHTMVDDLPEDEREMLDLMLYWGLKRAEAASVLAISPGAVECRWRNARLTLQEALQVWVRPQTLGGIG